MFLCNFLDLYSFVIYDHSIWPFYNASILSPSVPNNMAHIFKPLSVSDKRKGRPNQQRWLPWEYYPRIVFVHSHCQNINSQSQNHCFRELSDRWQKIHPHKLLFDWRQEKPIFGKISFDHASLFNGCSARTMGLKDKIFWPACKTWWVGMLLLTMNQKLVWKKFFSVVKICLAFLETNISWD